MKNAPFSLIVQKTHNKTVSLGQNYQDPQDTFITMYNLHYEAWPQPSNYRLKGVGRALQDQCFWSLWVRFIHSDFKRAETKKEEIVRRRKRKRIEEGKKFSCESQHGHPLSPQMTQEFEAATAAVEYYCLRHLTGKTQLVLKSHGRACKPLLLPLSQNNENGHICALKTHEPCHRSFQRLPSVRPPHSIKKKTSIIQFRSISFQSNVYWLVMPQRHHTEKLLPPHSPSRGHEPPQHLSSFCQEAVAKVSGPHSISHRLYLDLPRACFHIFFAFGKGCGTKTERPDRTDLGEHVLPWDCSPRPVNSETLLSVCGEISFGRAGQDICGIVQLTHIEL